MNAGLLKFCLGLSDGTSAAKLPERDPKDYKWLREALDNLEMDVDKMKRCVAVVQNKESSDEELKVALQEIQWLAENIDNANDLWKIKGVAPVISLLEKKDERTYPASVRALAVWVLGTLVQNNPESQDLANKAQFLPLLLNLVKTETDEKVKAKVVAALSGLLRDNAPALKLFFESNGMTTLTAVLLDSATLTSTKVKLLFFFNSLTLTVLRFDEIVIKLGLIPKIVEFLQSSDSFDLREKTLIFLESLANKNKSALKQQHITEALTRHQKRLQSNKDSIRDEVELVERLLQLVQ
eukprot:TRINITY_DN6859_c0_g1_i3.p1 TRINITY_DN6859_c0_g1~~TRINITY_DN6859_c0_g1_i3.p1  ORF type:complete len:307 (-),score=61.04 TRINITY_DN6859_c0_g1_i3:13-900(-)